MGEPDDLRRSASSENPAGAAFCMSCGAALAAPARPAAPRRPPAPSSAAPAARALGRRGGDRRRPARGRRGGSPRDAWSDGEVPDAEERRTVTVLFADLSGYTAIAERLDPETVKALVERCLTRLGDGGRALRRPRRQVHRRQRDGGLRRAGRARGRPRARGARRARHAGGDGRDQRASSARSYGVELALRVGRQHRRGARRAGRRRLHGRSATP